ncbi:MAG: tetratricopeptide repeat protein [Pseudomonadota bacterium]
MSLDADSPSEAPLSPFVFDATPDNFESLVLGNSRKGLVLVHFWSPKAGPCMILMPRLVRLATEYGGRFLMVMADTGPLSRQARSLGVTSVPTVKFFLNGQVVHTIHGAEPDSSFHEALVRFLASEADAERMAALALHQRGDTEGAIEQLARIAVERPEDLAVALDLAKLLTLAGRPGQALDLLSALPPADRQSPGIAPLLAHLELLDAANNGPEDAEALLAADPDHRDARLTLAARALFEEAPETALAHLLELARNAPDFREDLGRRALLALFGMLGAEHPLTRQYRAALASLRV